MRNAQLIVFGLLLSGTSFSHRYVCNGIVASGEERNDSCGICDDEHAARWPSPNIPVTIDESPLPEGISLADWHSVVETSLAAWNDVSGSNLRFFEVDADNPRDFGADETSHEIFWITDKEEWRRLVGVGEFGTLGATLPRYTCGGSEGAKRRIFDADLVLNGLKQNDTPIVNWQVKCEDDDCISIQTTLVHELGHFFGLDHPCLMCSTSIMSARAGFDLMYPVLDDLAGLRALYPDGSEGAFGSPCSENEDCASGKECIMDGANKYCSEECRRDKDCNAGAVCQENAGKKICMFVGGTSAGARLLGENCSRVPCVEPLICAGTVRDEYYCFLPCGKQSDCSGGQSCIALQDEISLCLNLKKKGEACDGKDLCDHDLFCLIEEDSLGSCREACGVANSSGLRCPSGETCQLFEAGQELCVPLNLNLTLDDNSLNFNGSKAPEKLGRLGKEAESPLGCSVLGLNDSQNSLSLWLVGLLMMLALRKGRGRDLV